MGTPSLVSGPCNPWSSKLICQNNRPQTRGSVRRRGALFGSVTQLHSRPGRWTCKPAPHPAPRLSTYKNKQGSACHFSPSLGTPSNLVLCWPFKPPGPSWGSGDKSKSLEQGPWEAERREVRTVGGDGSPSQQTAVVAAAGAPLGLAPS